MANRTTRDRLKRTLSENCIRNLEANQKALLSFIEIYSNSDEGAMDIALQLDMVMEAHEELKNAILAMNEEI